MSDQIIEQIKSDLESAASREHFDAVLRSAYAAGWTLQQLGEIVGVSREAIRMRMRRPVRAELLRDYGSPAKVRLREQKSKRRSIAKKRILGLKVTAPVMRVPVERLNEIRELHSLVTTVRGWTPLDDPARLAIEPFGDLLFSTMRDYNIPQTQLETVMGMGRSTFVFWLRSHGYLTQAPSQKTYQGVVIDRTTGGRTHGGSNRLQVGGTCRKGHLLTEETITRNGTTGNQICKVCRSEYSRRKYQQKKALRSA